LAATNVEVLVQAFGPALEPGAEPVDLASEFTDDEVVERLEALIAPDAPVTFETPDGGLMGDMAGPFRGAAGFRAGWREWTRAWDSFLWATSDLIDAGDGRVLVLGDSTARMSGTGLEIATKAGAVHEVRDGTIVRIDHFLDQDQARRAAGLG
jgi:ketosteroid isomerase-like protein